MFDSLEWTQWVLERDAYRRERALEAVCSRLTAQDVHSLIAKCSGADTEEQEPALRLLVQLARQRDPRLVAEPDNWGGWRRQLESLVQRHYPRLPLGPMALQGLMEADFDAAEHYLAEGLRVDGLSRGDSEIVVQQLGALDSAIALSRLVEIAELGDERGLLAERVLESKGVVDRKRMAVIAADWRRRRDVATLRRVYYSFIDHLPEGAPIEDIIGLLGEPQRRAQNTIWYEAGGRSIYLEVDDRGRLGGRGLD